MDMNTETGLSRSQEPTTRAAWYGGNAEPDGPVQAQSHVSVLPSDCGQSETPGTGRLAVRREPTLHISGL